MKVLFATSEFADFSKVGGLGEVSASLPRGMSTRTSTPRRFSARAAIPASRSAEARTSDGLLLYLVRRSRCTSAADRLTATSTAATGPTRRIVAASDFLLMPSRFAGGMGDRQRGIALRLHLHETWRQDRFPVLGFRA
ncbi:MAG: glycogen/starch synthase [Alphaproteobacteria bacterium]|nr:glycogen/starch synthase [Alphaproteobacteria bacterium]MBV8407928.1 glycogen/starch synthase [Alphaproteobacteria bacterium]